MTTAAWVLLGVAAVFAVSDWIAVARGSKPLEYVCKPAATLSLVGVAIALDPVHGDTRTLFVVALVLSLAGDVFLMLPGDRFVPGLASFLLAQITFAVGFCLHAGSVGDLALGTAIVVAIAVPVSTRVLRALLRKGRRDLLGPVVAYMLAISAMVASAVGSANAWGIAGAAWFFVSDALIAESRFVREPPVPATMTIMSGDPAKLDLLDEQYLGSVPEFPGFLPIAIMVTYHLALVGLVLSLV